MAQGSGKFKGVLFYVHGFSDYSGRNAYIARIFSAMGYDFFCMDQRGHGQSGGKTVLVPSMKTIQND